MISVIDVALVLLAASLGLGIVRLARGPWAVDRAVVADMSFLLIIATITLVAARFSEPAFIDVVLVASLLGFVATLVLADLVERWNR